MNHLMKPLAAVIIGSSVLMGGCMGKFALTDKLYTWNKQVDGNKWVQEAVFVALLIIPVYSLSLLADGIIFNSVEWWTGSNPILAGETRKVQGTDGSEALMTMRADGVIDVEVTAADGARSAFTLAMQDGEVKAGNVRAF